jgi:hypothetical protein
MKARRRSRGNVHARPLADRFKPLKDLDVVTGVFLIGFFDDFFVGNVFLSCIGTCPLLQEIPC